MPQITDPSFTIRIDALRKYVEICLLGLWDEVTAKRFDHELRRLLPALTKGGCPIGEQNTLFDSTGYAVQAQDVTTHLAGMAADRSIGSRRIAVLVSSTLSKLQTRRIAPGYGVFDDRAEAMTWLFEPDV
ncbi:hypothetical protein G4G27_14825 [Sphingomonas sp. So64.6b]|uniref:hypothetical protein n=1 Tax=Sphingomonas sp. So64.6b TaxID=2997354 RepID=UPI00160270D8|nr:hypothetical protein [Sphingomonas sp. So64.6b]QNA85126.1 hypothetical protein G4G27_14825 [Sphingomonas sp. So64.6b]